MASSGRIYLLPGIGYVAYDEAGDKIGVYSSQTEATQAIDQHKPSPSAPRPGPPDTTDTGASPNGPASRPDSPLGVAPAATTWRHTIRLGGGYYMTGTGAVGEPFAAGTWQILFEKPTGNTLNGKPTYEKPALIAEGTREPGTVIDRVITALYTKAGYPNGGIGGDRMWWQKSLTDSEVLAAVASPSTKTYLAPTTPTTVPAAPAPGVDASLADAPKRAVLGDAQRSAEAAQTIADIAREMASRTAEPTIMATSDPLKGYTPIKLRPRSR